MYMQIEQHHHNICLTDQISCNLMQATLEEKLKKSEELRSTFHHFLTEVAKAAENSKTGRPIPHKVLSDYTKHEAIKDAELQKVRLRHLMLKAQLAKIEHRVKQKVRFTLTYKHACMLLLSCHRQPKGQDHDYEPCHIVETARYAVVESVLHCLLLISKASQASVSTMHGGCW
jgi:hypothetical protein